MKDIARRFQQYGLNWRYLLDVAARRFARNIYWEEPRGAEDFRRARNRDYEEFIKAAKAANLIPVANRDYTGAGTTDYLVLDRFVAKARPLNVLELGGGLTTYVIANALREMEKTHGQRGHLVSVDHISEYSEGAKELLPADLQPYTTFHLSPMLQTAIYADISAVRYRDIPEERYDLMFVDGPPTILGKEQFPSIDPLLHLKPGHQTSIIIDRRFPTLSYMSLWLKKPVNYDPILKLGFVDRVSAEDIIASPNSWKQPNVRIASLLPALS